MTARQRIVSVLAAAALVVPTLGGCGVDTQTTPERIPPGQLPAELRTPQTVSVPGGR
jgi:hypothetical protein